jgi:hypothetical protein
MPGESIIKKVISMDTKADNIGRRVGWLRYLIKRISCLRVQQWDQHSNENYEDNKNP